jgi:cobalt/nickel transport system ATP-binding protein
MSEIFRLEDVSFTHPGGTRKVLNNMNLTIEEGSRNAILGANGAGKTTLFYTLTGVYKPQEGTVYDHGAPIEYTKDGLRNLRSDVAVILQNPDEQIFCSLVEEDVAFGPLNLGLDKEETAQRVAKALRDVRMTPFARRPLQQLSGGQRKRVAIAGALAMNPKIMIMDEPTAGLDPQASMEVMELAEKLHLQGVTVLISTHDIDIIYKWADTSDIICDGRIEYSGPAEGFYSDPETVYRCGLLTPSMFNMNRDICALDGMDPAPYPRNSCEFTAKFGNPKKSGRIICVGAEEEDAPAKYEEVMKDLSGVQTGVYGSDVRYALTDKNIDIQFDAMDMCFTGAVEGKDSVLFYDAIYAPTIKEQADRLRKIGFDVDMEVI